MRAALISLPPLLGGNTLMIGGKSLSQRQLDFALHCGCELIILHGHGTAPEAIALRQSAEDGGARFQLVTSAHALIGVIGKSDTLLVLQAELLPEAAQGLEALISEPSVLVLSSGAGVQAGFERIDLERAWSGALSMPGEWLEQLNMLPEDVAPAPALLRIALQNRLAEVRLSDGHLEDGSWRIIPSDETGRSHEKQWLQRQFGEGQRFAVSQTIARRLLLAYGAKIAGERVISHTVLGIALLLLISSVLVAWQGVALAAFLLVALAAPVVEVFLGLEWMDIAPFGRLKRWPYLRYLIDGVLVVCALFTIQAAWYQAAFTAVVLGLGLLISGKINVLPWAELPRDRGVVALILAILVSMLPGEQAVMIIAVSLLSLIFGSCINQRS